MLWLKLAWRNIWRNPGRTCIQLLAIAGSLALVIWMQNLTRGSYNKMIEDGVRMGSGHLSLHHPDYPEQRLAELFFDVDAGMGILQSESNEMEKLPRLQIAGLARSSHDSRSAMILGVNFAAEKKINPLLSDTRRQSGEIPAPGDEKTAYIGVKLAESLRLKTGNKLVLMMQDFNGEIASRLYRIAGIFKSGVSQVDGSTVFVSCSSLAAGLGNANAVHEIALILPQPEKLDYVLARLQKACAGHKDIAAFSWEITSKQLADTIKMDHSQLKVMVVIFFLLVTIGTVNLMLMSVIERTREFGLLQALGMNHRKIRILIFTEALLLGIIGAASGFAMGSIFSWYTWYFGLDFSSAFGAQEIAGMLFEPVIRSAWEWHWMIALSLTMIVLVLLAALYPTNKALRIRPAEAMRRF
ncbi:MAG: ABC transporter permease [Candidatus Rifleibacteriota bacterium]